MTAAVRVRPVTRKGNNVNREMDMSAEDRIVGMAKCIIEIGKKSSGTRNDAMMKIRMHVGAINRITTEDQIERALSGSTIIGGSLPNRMMWSLTQAIDKALDNFKRAAITRKYRLEDEQEIRIFEAFLAGIETVASVTTRALRKELDKMEASPPETRDLFE